MNWELFISHASEDKSEVAIPLTKKLKDRGISVWLDIDEIHLGDSIREKIDFGLANCDYALVVLSEDYISKKWTTNELNALFSLEDVSRKRILPVLHNISFETVVQKFPVLSDRANSSTEDGLNSVVGQVLSVIRPEGSLIKHSEIGSRKDIDSEIYSLAKLKAEQFEYEDAREILSKHIFKGSEKANAKILSIICYLAGKDIFSLNRHIVDSLCREILIYFNLGNPLAVCLMFIIYYEYFSPKRIKLSGLSKFDILSKSENLVIEEKYIDFIWMMKISRQTSILLKSSLEGA